VRSWVSLAEDHISRVFQFRDVREAAHERIEGRSALHCPARDLTPPVWFAVATAHYVLFAERAAPETDTVQATEAAGDAHEDKEYDVNDRDRIIDYVIYRMRSMGLQITRRYFDAKTDAVLIRAPFAVLQREAERIGLAKELDPKKLARHSTVCVVVAVGS
jgi:hypothetical protein